MNSTGGCDVLCLIVEMKMKQRMDGIEGGFKRF